MPTPVDPVDLTARLVRCPSVTPFEGGALALLAAVLTEAGFDCTRVDRNHTPNLFARWGAKGDPRTLGFNGHTDVVPVGDAAAWTADPFGGELREGFLWGRGSTDMKSGVAAFACAAVDFVRETPPDGAIILAVTGDEEGDATDGTRALLDWMLDHDERMSLCIVGEPTSTESVGDVIKIGRRGSMTARFTVTGVQGHTAYPHLARNPVHAVARLMDRLATHVLDEGTDHFDPSTLAVTTIDTGNPATNVVPARCTATVNIRFNDVHTSQSIRDWLDAEGTRIAAETGCDVSMDVRVSGESFITPPGPLSELVVSAIRDEMGIEPVLSTTGGTSDARFVKTHCPVIECGLASKTMHQVDERVDIEQIRQLKALYARVLRDYFG